MSTHDALSVIPDAATISLIQELTTAKRNGDAEALMRAEPLFKTTPGLREVVYSIAAGTSYAKTQGDRSRARKLKYEKRYVARARAYLKRRNDPQFEGISNSDLKRICGNRPVKDPTNPERYLPALERSRAIEAIDIGLALIETGRFVLSSG